MYVFLTPSKTDGRVPSQQGTVYLQHPTWVTAKFPSRRISSHFWPIWVRPQDKIQTFRWGVEGGIETWVWPKGEFIPSGLGKFLAKNSCQIFYTSNPNRHPQLYFSKQHFPSLDISLLPIKLPSSKKTGLKNIYFFRNRSIGCPWCMLWLFKLILEHVLVFLFIHILKTVYL